MNAFSDPSIEPEGPVDRAPGREARGLEEFVDATLPATYKLAFLLTRSSDSAEELVCAAYRLALSGTAGVAESWRRPAIRLLAHVYQAGKTRVGSEGQLPSERSVHPSE